MKCRVLRVCLSVSVSVSVWEGGDSWLREVTGKHGSKFLPFGGPPRPPIEFLFWDHWETVVLGTEESGGTAGKGFEKNERI